MNISLCAIRYYHLLLSLELYKISADQGSDAPSVGCGVGVHSELFPSYRHRTHIAGGQVLMSGEHGHDTNTES